MVEEPDYDQGPGRDGPLSSSSLGAISFALLVGCGSDEPPNIDATMTRACIEAPDLFAAAQTRLISERGRRVTARVQPSPTPPSVSAES